MIAAAAFGAELFAAAEAQQQAEAGNEEKAQDTQTPGESPLLADDLGAVAFGAAVDPGDQLGLRLHRDIHRHLHRLGENGSRAGRKLGSAADADAVGGVLNDLNIAVFTTHIHSSFFSDYRRWSVKMQDNQIKNK